MGLDLNTVIDRYLMKLKALESTKKAVIKWDGKKITKRFDTFLAKETDNLVRFSDYKEPRGYASFFVNYREHFGMYSYAFEGIFGKEDIIHIYSNDYWEMVDENGKLIASKLISHLDNQKKELEDEIKMMQGEIGKEEDLIREYNDLVDKLEKKYKSMSYELKAQNKEKFHKIIYCVR